MKLSHAHLRPKVLLEQMSSAAPVRFSSDAAWAAASRLPKETLSRLKKNSSCDLRTLGALAKSAGCTLVAVPETAARGAHEPEAYSREYEDALLQLCASGNADATLWSTYGPPFFMGGLAVLLASARGFERERYLRLAEALHPGISTPEVFALWLERTPVRAARFLPMARRRRALR